MCGITGIMAFNEIGRMHMIHLARATGVLSHRGPDYQGTYISDQVALGHRRLSVIDPRPEGHQPMSDSTGRYHLVYNGEIYNYRELRKQLQNSGREFTSETDTEVLLYLFIEYGERCLELLNGCFAFAVLDTLTNQLFLARDRYGINPLLYYQDDDKFVFASEMRSILAYNIPKILDYESLELYLELNYLPAPHTMLSGVKKILPGSFITVGTETGKQGTYYSIPDPPQGSTDPPSYQDCGQKISDLLEQSVTRRLVSDVPLGAFLSGGIDSSIVVALASKHVDQLNTFSIGYRDQPYFDETDYANLVADRFNTNHTVFKLTDDELFQHLSDLWEHLDEPFADSSALPTYILSKYTRRKVTVALSGDGADELFGGYNKHLALERSLQRGLGNSLIKSMSVFSGLLPKSRNGSLTNKFRQFDRMAQGLKLDLPQRYWLWASITPPSQVRSLLDSSVLPQIDEQEINRRKHHVLGQISANADLNQLLRTDLQLVLPNDMLTKVDWMSMAHGLEVRVPYLDHELVQYVTGLPSSFKVHRGMRKRILQDAFREILPKELYKRPKKGFEVPLLGWMRGQLFGTIENELLHSNLIKEQGIFNSAGVESLKRRLQSRNPGDSPAQIWALLVFQKWWEKYQPQSSKA